jgi:uncharacterized membrane protein YphA (DoxX/SURF4 family)
MGSDTHGHGPVRASRFSKLRFALDLVLRVALGALFLYTGIVKALDLTATAQAVSGYAVLPGYFLYPAAFWLTFFEIALGTLLLLGLFTRPAAAGVAVMAVVFMAALIQAKVRDLDITCGCFNASTTGNPVTLLEILRDVPILAVAIYLAVRRSGPWGLDRLLAARLSQRNSD